MDPFASSKRSIIHRLSSPFIHSRPFGRLRQMANPSGLEYLSTGISLSILAIGFILLGLLALINRRQSDLAGASIAENEWCVIGSIVSIFAGAIFLATGWIYWRRRSPTAVAPVPEERRSHEGRSPGFMNGRHELKEGVALIRDANWSSTKIELQMEVPARSTSRRTAGARRIADRPQSTGSFNPLQEEFFIGKGSGADHAQS
jgi:hypothetical protein